MDDRAPGDLYVVRFEVPGARSLGEPDDVSLDPSAGDDADGPTGEKTTFAYFGLAYYRASVLEHELVNILAATRLVRAREDAERLLSDPWDDRLKATMGALVKELAPHLDSDPTLSADLMEALRLRNHLAHAFWRERAEDFCTATGRARMITFLASAASTFDEVDRRLTESVGAAALHQWGVTADVIDAWYGDMLKRIERGELDVPLETVESTRQSLLARLAMPKA
jgi:hypothetical protein